MSDLTTLTHEVRQLLLDELRAKGYAPNPQDVVVMADKVIALVKAEAPISAVVEPAPVEETEPAHVPTVAERRATVFPVAPVAPEK